MKNLNEMISPNEEELKLFSLLPMDASFREGFEKTLNNGVRKFRDSTFVVSCLVRNCEDRLLKNIGWLTTILQEAKDYRFIIYENDSEDLTPMLLRKLANENDKILVTTETHGRKQYGPIRNAERTKNLAEYRNANLSVIQDRFSDFDYTIVLDLDFEEFYATSLMHSIGVMTSNDIDAICGVAYQMKPFEYEGQTYHTVWNYDTWAYRPNTWLDLSRIVNVQGLPAYSEGWYNYCILPVGSEPYTVYSGFGGMAIYKNSQYIQGKYSGGDCEHVLFHRSLNEANPNFLLACNPSQITLMPYE